MLGLLLVTVPLIWLLVLYLRKGQWKPNVWQVLAFSGPLLAFLVVGLIVSVKIGGGSNLHNLDMFLITLVIVAALAWEAGLGKDFGAMIKASPAVRNLVLLVLVIPTLNIFVTARAEILPPQEKTERILLH